MTYILAGLVSLILLFPGLLFLLATISTEARARTGRNRSVGRGKPKMSDGPVRFLIVVPAHNEETVIAECVDSLKSLNYPANAYRKIVVADNCTDDTATIVRDRGVECLERHDSKNRGKPHALAWAIDRLDLNGWNYLVVVDADTRVDSDFLSALAQQAGSTPGAHLQAYYGLANPDETWLTRLSNLLVRVRYEVLYPRKERVGLNSPLTGNGMCFKIEIFRKQGWPFFSLTENWLAYAALTVQGAPIRFVPGARLYAEESVSPGGSSTRRQRWLAGRYGVLMSYWRRIIRASNLDRLQKLDILSELSYPGPVVHAAMVVTAGLTAVITLPVSLAVTVSAIGMLTLGPVLIPAVQLAKQSDETTALIKAASVLPLYGVWRVGVAAVTVIRGLVGMEWEKTDRDPEGPGKPMSN